MRRFWIPLTLAGLWFNPAAAQLALLHGGLGAPGGTPPPSFVGAADVITTLTTYWGLQAASGALAATGTTKSINLRNDVTSATADIVILTTGQLDTAAVATLAGTDATCTGSISSTTMTISSCASGTLHIGDTITGTGVTPGTFITVINTCASPPGNCIVYPGQTAAGPTLTAAAPVSITRWYDQIGGADCIAPDAAHQRQLILNFDGTSLPAAFTNPANSHGSCDATLGSSVSAPFTLSFVGDPFSPAAAGMVMGTSAYMYGDASLGVQCNAGSALENTGNFTVNKWLSATCSVDSGTNRGLMINGVDQVGATGTTALGTVVHFGNYASSGFEFSGGIFEGMIDGTVAATAAKRTALCQNQQSRLGAGNFGATC